MTKPYVIGVDPSGSFKEGKGTTGIVVLDPDCKLVKHFTVEAKDYDTQIQYWTGVCNKITETATEFSNVVLSVEDYVLYATSAKAQINSEMETSKLIGAIALTSYKWQMQMYIRSASQVMNRWTNKILEHKQIIYQQGQSFTDIEGTMINRHCLDALRHAVHCHYFEVDKKKGEF